jgi:hypothetical protein
MNNIDKATALYLEKEFERLLKELEDILNNDWKKSDLQQLYLVCAKGIE